MEQEKKKYSISLYRAPLWVIAVSLLYAMRDVMGVSIPEVFFLAVCGMGFIILQPEESFCLMVFTIQLTLPNNEIRLLYVLSLLLKGKLHYQFKMFITVLGMLVLQLVDAAVFTSGGSIFSLLYDYVTFALCLIIPFMWGSLRYNRDALIRAAKYFIYSVIFIGLITVYMTVQARGWAILLGGNNRLGMGINSYFADSAMRTANNTNAIGVSAACAVAVLIPLLNKKCINKIFGIIVLSICVILSFLTRSRTAFISLGIVALLFYFYTIKEKRALRKGLVLISVVVLAVLAISHYMPEIWRGTINRFIGQEDITNSRGIINAEYINVWSSNIWCMFFGYGALSYLNVTNVGISPHNMIVDILISWGLIGLILMFAFLTILTSRSIKGINKKERILYFLPAIVKLFAVMGGQYLTVPKNHLQLCFLLIMMSFLCDDEMNTKNEV